MGWSAKPVGNYARLDAHQLISHARPLFSFPFPFHIFPHFSKKLGESPKFGKFP